MCGRSVTARRSADRGSNRRTQFARAGVAAEIGGAHPAIGQYLGDRALDCFGRRGLAEMGEHHRARPDLTDRVGDAAPGDVGAEPCTGSNIDGYSRSGLMLPEGAMPIEPTTAGPKSDRMSPNRFDPTTTSNQSGWRTKCAVRMSMWYWSVRMSG